MSVSALIAEDHDLTRQGLRSLLTERLGARVAAATGDGLEAFPLVEEHRPDLLVLDLGLPHLNGLHVLRKIQAREVSPQSVVLSMYSDETYVRKAFELGASGYVLKGAPLNELTAALRTALDGERYLSSGLPENLVEPARTPDPAPGDRYDRLTDREREVLHLTAEGYTSTEVGDRLSISPRTVEKHREHIQNKLDLRNVVEMAAYVHQRALPAAPPPSEVTLQPGVEPGGTP
jgi:DNA-binding NarL/FixJ family response regulator